MYFIYWIRKKIKKNLIIADLSSMGKNFRLDTIVTRENQRIKKNL